MTDTIIPTSEVLYRAADLIEQRGWVRVNGWAGSEGAPLCLEGGIQAALGVASTFQVQTCPAGQAVVAYLGRENCTSILGNVYPWVWNDVFERTADEVIETLRACAVIEAAKEQAAVDTPAVSVAPVRSGL